MEFQRDIAPPPAPQKVDPEPEPVIRRSRVGGMSFSEALAVVEAHRDRVQVALGISLVARLLVDFNFIELAKTPQNLVAELPYVGLAMLSYMIVLWFLAARTRDRWGFGMALGIGVLQATYMLVMIVLLREFTIATAWKPLVVAAAHIALAVMAFRAGSAYPALDSKRPWILGFATAFIFVAIPWVAPAFVDAMGW